MSETKKNEITENRREIKDLMRVGKAFSFIGPAISKAYEQDGEYYIESIASSDQEDLVGDVMAQKALDTMKTQFVGKTVFMNHRTNVPDDVFGSVVSCEFVKEGGMVLLKMLYIVEQENEGAMKTYRILAAKRVQLGSSVTVMVKSYKPNPKRKTGIIIEDVEPIEVSIVGVPCNRESKTMSASASKALDAALKSKEFEMKEDETEAIEAAQETPAEEPAVETADQTVAEPEQTEKAEQAEQTEPENKSLAAANAARLKFVELLKKIDDGEELPEAQEITIKGMFNEILEQAPTFWELVYILDEVRWRLSYNAYLIKEGGSEDYTAILADYSEALDEFKVAAMSSFKWWNEIERDATSKFADLEEINSSVKAAHDLENGLKEVVTASNSVKAEAAKKEFGEIGQRMIRLAKELGIPVGDTDPAKPEVDADAVETLEKQLGDAIQKAADLRIELDESNTQLEIARAGLELLVEANKDALGKPLNIGDGR